MWTSGQPPKSYLKARGRLSELTGAPASMRQDFWHRTTGAIIQIASQQGNDLIFMEDLHVAGMSRSARVCTQNPERNVRAKSNLNRSILIIQMTGVSDSGVTISISWRSRRTPTYVAMTGMSRSLTRLANWATSSSITCFRATSCWSMSAER